MAWAESSEAARSIERIVGVAAVVVVADAAVGVSGADGESMDADDRDGDGMRDTSVEVAEEESVAVAGVDATTRRSNRYRHDCCCCYYCSSVMVSLDDAFVVVGMAAVRTASVTVAVVEGKLDGVTEMDGP